MEIYNKQKGAASPGAFAGEPRAFHALPSALRRVPTSELASETPLVRRVKQQFPSRDREFLRERLGGGTLTRSVRAES